jgi:HlyD family secretion protein
VDIRAPQDGTVFQLSVHTVGGVISPGEAIMLIVPDADSLTVEAKVNPQDIEQVQLRQTAVLRFPAFNAATTPEINGEVSRISADITSDQRTGQSYYTIRISIPPDQLSRLGDVRLVPGMPVECFIQTGIAPLSLLLRFSAYAHLPRTRLMGRTRLCAARYTPLHLNQFLPSSAL